MLMNAMFGGTSNSKLFLNVREKLSLCYYAGSAYHIGTLVVDIAADKIRQIFPFALHVFLQQPPAPGDMTRQLLMNNVYLTYIPSEKFKTSFLSAQMAAPLEKETAGRNALLVNVLNSRPPRVMGEQ